MTQEQKDHLKMERRASDSSKIKWAWGVFTCGIILLLLAGWNESSGQPDIYVSAIMLTITGLFMLLHETEIKPLCREVTRLRRQLDNLKQDPDSM